jgi:hypothetical protein
VFTNEGNASDGIRRIQRGDYQTEAPREKRSTRFGKKSEVAEKSGRVPEKQGHNREPHDAPGHNEEEHGASFDGATSWNRHP